MTAQETLDFLNSASIEASPFKRIFTVDKTEDSTIYNYIINDDAVIPKDQIIKLTGGDEEVMVIGDGINTYSNSVKMWGGGLPKRLPMQTVYISTSGHEPFPIYSPQYYELDTLADSAMTMIAKVDAGVRNLNNYAIGYTNLITVDESRTLTVDDVGVNKALKVAVSGGVLSLPSDSITFAIGSVINILNISGTSLEIAPTGELPVIISNGDKGFVAESSRASLTYLGGDTWFLEGNLVDS